MILRHAGDLTGAWLSGALDRPGIELAGLERIGTGQMSLSYRVRFAQAGGPKETVVLKLAAEDATSRATGVGMGAYFRETAFYSNLAARIGGPVPECRFCAYDPAEGWFTLLLEDIAGADQGDQIEGCGAERAEVALRALARIHAPVLGDLQVGSADFLNQPNPLNQALLTALAPQFLERYRDRIAPKHAEVVERLVPVLDALEAERQPPLGLVHGDYRLDNLLFAEDSCKVVDWQTVGWGPAMTDAAYFVGGALTDADRRASEEALVRAYHDELRAQGVNTLSWEEAWEGYRRATFAGIVMVTAASMVVERTDRGDDMFMAWLARNAQQIIDLDALDILPAPDAGPPAPLRPEPSDEGCHSPGPEPLWNESWYFDAVADDGSLGMYTRLGRLPNQDAALLMVCVTGVDRRCIMLAEQVALPAADDPRQVVDLPGTVHIEQVCEEPLQRFRVTMTGTAQAHADASAPLRGEHGEPLEIAFDLTWETAGVPYAWRQATRYEIPCRVTGTLRIGDEEIASFAGPGQRDHSWGARDWWAVDWMWNGLHLEDGTHVHQVGVPVTPGLGVGYVQRDGELTEITTLEMDADFAENGLPLRARTSCGPDGLVLEIEPLAFGALRLESPDGRVSHFPRVMCRVTSGDGASGTGWIEWNRVQRGNG